MRPETMVGVSIALVVVLIALVAIEVYIVLTKEITATIGQEVSAGGWAVKVLGVNSTEYVKEGDVYYAAPTGSKIVVVWLRVKNVGRELDSPRFLADAILITDAGKGYDRVIVPGDIVQNATESVKLRAVEVRPLDPAVKLVLGGADEGCILFRIPANEAPRELWLRISWRRVKVKLG